MYISEKHRFVFGRVHKTASATTSNWLMSEYGAVERMDPECPWGEKHGLYVPSEYQSYWKFMTVRNPFQRLVSLWLHSRRYEDCTLWGGLLLREQTEFPEFLALVMGDRDFPPFPMQVECRDTMDADTVLRFEDFPACLMALPFVDGTPKLGHIHRTDYKSPWMKHYADSAVRALARVYTKLDCEELGYVPL